MTHRLLVVLLCAAPLAAQAARSPQIPRSVARVSVTTQAYDFLQPWRKKAPRSHQALGAVLEGGRLLVSAELMQNHTYIEVQKPGTGEKTPAEVEVVDYSANLALISVADKDFMSAFKPLRIGRPPRLGEEVEVWRLQENDALLRTEALLTVVQMTSYPQADLSLPAYHLTSSLPSQGSGVSLPLVQKGKLIGVVIRHEADTQSLFAIPESVIRHFLADLEDGEYEGFPRLGVGLADTQDPQFKQYIGLPPDAGGVYITRVGTGSAGEQAGLQAGDVIQGIGGHDIDQNGDYEHALYGRVYLSYLVSVGCQAGDALELSIRREGETVEIEAAPQRKGLADYVSPPYVIDTPPRYLIVGGLVIQELSRQYLMSWGDNWEQKADQKLVYYHANQDTLFPEGDRKIVFLSRVLPTSATTGYTSLNQLVLATVNDHAIRSLEDVQEALKTPDEGLHHFEFEDSPRVITLSHAAAARANQMLRRRYGITIMRQ